MQKMSQTKTLLVTKTEDSSNKTLLDRKSMLPNYKKLFEALFEIPDKKVVARVFDAINKKEKDPIIEVIEICSKCNQRTSKTTFVDASTQTEEKFIMQHKEGGRNDESRDTPSMLSTKKTLPESEPASIKDEHLSGSETNKAPKKRKRRRKMQVPQVIKKSQAQEQQRRSEPALQKRKATALKAKTNTQIDDSISIKRKRQRQDSVSSRTTSISDFCEENILEATVTLEEITNKMAYEWIRADCIEENGLLPIHNAIVNEDSKCLERQIIVWKQLKHTNLNELLTNDDEDCLQLAVSENSSTEIVRILLSNGLNANCIDPKFNTIIHLAILNETSTDVMHLLMEKIDLKSLYIQNYDGFTPLHLAVRQNNYMLAEALMDALDKRLLGKVYYDRPKEPKESHFLKYYESRCERSNLETYLPTFKEHFSIKERLINAGELCSGNTALLHAIENKLEHLIYFLLAHFADPKVENLSGQSPSSFMNEFAKSLNLSLKIDQIMVNIDFIKQLII